MRAKTIGAALLLLAACSVGSGGKFMPDNVAQITPGMSSTQVQDLIGPPYSMSTTFTSEGRMDTAIWMHASLGGSRSLVLNFVNGYLRGLPGQALAPPAGASPTPVR